MFLKALVRLVQMLGGEEAVSNDTLWVKGKGGAVEEFTIFGKGEGESIDMTYYRSEVMLRLKLI